MSNKRKGHGSSTVKNTDWWQLLTEIDLDRKVIQEFFELVKQSDFDDEENQRPGGLSILHCCLLYLNWLKSGESVKSIEKTVNQSDSTLSRSFSWISSRLNCFLKKWLSKDTSERRLQWSRDDQSIHSAFNSITAILDGFHTPHDHQAPLSKEQWRSPILKRSAVSQLVLISRNGRWLWLSKQSYPAGAFTDDSKVIEKEFDDLREGFGAREHCLINRHFEKSLDNTFILHLNPSSNERDNSIFQHFQTTVFHSALDELRSRWKFAVQPFRGASKDFNLHLRCVFALDNLVRFPGSLKLQPITEQVERLLPSKTPKFLEDFDPKRPFSSGGDHGLSSMLRTVVEDTVVLTADSTSKRHKFIVSDETDEE